MYVQVRVQYSSTNLHQKEKKGQIRNPYTLGFMRFGEERKKEKKKGKKKGGGFLLDNVMYCIDIRYMYVCMYVCKLWM